MNALIVLVIVAALLIVIVVKVAVSIAKREIKKHGGYLIWWYVSGHHYGGARDCCRQYCPPRVRWRRARRRLSPFAVTLAIALALLLHLGLLLAAPVGLLAGLVLLYPRRAHRVGRVVAVPAMSAVARRIPLPAMPAISAPEWTVRAVAPAVELVALAQRQRDTGRYVVAPLAPALGPLLEMPAPNARKIITLKPGYLTAKDGEIGTIGPLPPAFRADPGQRRAVEHLVSARLPVDVDFQWRTGGFPQSIALLAAPQCPPMVMFEDMLSEMAKCKPGEIVFGVDRREDVFRGSFRIDDPHWGFSVGSGRGKSTKLQCAAAQILHADLAATVTGIDPKMASLTPLIGIPGVVIANDPRNIGEWDREAQRCHGGMWGAIDDFKDEMMARLDALATDPTLTFPIKLLILDECNMFGAMTAAKWRVLRDSKAGDPPVPPPWAALAAIHWMGRQVSCHCITVGQRLDDKATGGIGLRSAMGLVGIAGYRQKEWDLLIGTRPMPKSQRPKGRWLYDNGSDQTWVQNVCASTDPAEAGIIIRNYAAAGRSGLVHDDVPVGLVPATPPGQMPVSGTGTNAVWVVGIEAGAAVLGISAESFRKRRYRAGGSIPGEIRQGNQPAWTELDLIAWADSGRDRQSAEVS